MKLSQIYKSILFAALFSIIMGNAALAESGLGTQIKHEYKDFILSLPQKAQLLEQRTRSVNVKANEKMLITTYVFSLSDTSKNDMSFIVNVMSAPNKSSVTINDQRNALTGMVDGIKNKMGLKINSTESNKVYRNIKAITLSGKEFQIYKLTLPEGSLVFYALSANNKLYLLMFSIPSTMKTNELIQTILKSLIIK